MPLPRLLLLLLMVISAAGLTVWLGAIVANRVALTPVGIGVALTVVVVGTLMWRIISNRR
ncbi:MAG: hypothetical protein KUG69_13035 [Marinosulfonomonas sp.]|nr:hypothetical protein [Marinosulfonomonas sp.]